MDDNMGDVFWLEEPSGQPPWMKSKRRAKKRKLEFVGWGSRPLIEFLEAIGQDTTKKHSQHEVASLISKYIKDNNLASAAKKKKVLCDERLYYIFGKKSIPRIKIPQMLKEHFAETHSDSDSDMLDTSEEEDHKNNATSQKQFLRPPRNCFAAIVPENIKLIYLKRSLIQELLKVPESIEYKITGSFIRMKSDPNDIYQKNRFQLQLVTGVVKVPGTGDTGVEIHLRVSNFFKEIPISQLSDDNFSEEELEDLKDRVKAGLLKKMTSELELKAKMLHVDITNHRIEKELAVLPNLIDRANEKGWRKEFFEHRERKKLLETPSEREKLLKKIPEVIAEEEPKKALVVPSETPERESPPASTVGGSSNLPSADALKVRIGDPNSSVPDNNSNDALKVRTGEANSSVLINNTNTNTNDALGVPIGDVNSSMLVNNVNGYMISFESPKQMNQMVIPRETMPEIAGNVVNGTIRVMQSPIDRNFMQQETMLAVDKTTPQEKPPTTKPAAQPETIELIESSDECSQDDAIWHYFDPQGDTQGPFTLTSLKRWNDSNYFHPGFMIWRRGDTSDNAVLLADVLRRRNDS
ncbi:uncharacterized protein At5g08430 isoform X2 [Andrographis paniculata]|uniref:uncharacterized protein At5g08430 isoform X2 n=1 Tax=Andrographis paniculata TaxID=175694 RepID=UPI0021E7B727|nr:uncharacterized protein At5g08430 isoform X2 [Andrographis paniculata]